MRRIPSSDLFSSPHSVLMLAKSGFPECRWLGISGGGKVELGRGKAPAQCRALFASRLSATRSIKHLGHVPREFERMSRCIGQT